MPIDVKNFIDGKFVSPDDGQYISSYDPSTGLVWANIPDSRLSDVDRAVDAAKQAFKGWSNFSAYKRSKIMMKIADLIEVQLEKFAQAESQDQGKTITMARTVDIPRAIYNFRFFATSILHDLNSSTYQEDFGALNYTVRTPVGVTGLISPWNLPLYLLTFKIAPAIGYGNTVVAKPSEMTSITAWMLCNVFEEAGLPKGVVNIVHGYGGTVGEAIVKNPDIPLISFTGSTLTAQHIRVAASPFSKKLSLELGGKNACIIFDDANLDLCVPTTVRSSFSNQGEICLCTSRIFVQKGIFDVFLEKFIAATKLIRVGKPSDSSSIMGALISKEHLAKVRGYVKIARESGATIHCGDGVDSLNLPPACEKGYFMLPTIISNIADDTRPMQEEIFGPVVCVSPFTTVDEVIRRANGVQYGLCGVVWSRNAAILNRMDRALEVGTLWKNCWLVRDLNMPFGGCKSSGVGREGHEDSRDFFTNVKTVCNKIDC